MDPMSASVAIIGFAASLTTLAAVVIDSSRTLYNVRRKFKKAPEDIKRLCRQLREFECLLLEVQERIRDSPVEHAASGMGTLFIAAIEHIRNDMSDFDCAVQQLKGLLNTRTSPRESFLLRVRHVLQEDRVREYQFLISSHVGTLTLLLQMVTSRKLHIVSLQTTKLLEKTEARLDAIQSGLEVFQSSQNARQGTLTSIENRLCDLQEQVGAGALIMRKGVERTVIRDAKLPWTYRRTSTDLMFLGRVMSSHNLVTSKESNEPTVRHLSFTFIPPPWISRIVLHWNLQIQKTLSGLPKISVSLSPLRYNANQKLKAAVTSFDIPGLQRVFREGLARPTDYILQRKPISILEVFAARADKPNNETLAMYRYLLKEGCGNGDPLLATSHARVLISFAKSSQSQLKDALESFLTYGGNILWRHSSWGSILSLIMRHGASFKCLPEYLLRQPEPWTVNDLLPMDRWLVGILEHTNERFRKALQYHFSKYRSNYTAAQVCSNIDTIVSEVQAASTRDRVEFLKIVSKWGTRDMILPFIAAGFDLDEKSSNEQMPWLRLSYLSKATKWANLNTFQTLLDAGACPTRALIFLSRHPDSLPPCEDPESRKKMILTLARNAQPRHPAAHDEELLSLLLRTDDVRRYCSAAADELIDRFILQRHNIIESKSDKLLNSYILVSIVLNTPSLLHYLSSSGFQVSGNNSIGKVLGGQHVYIKGDVVGNYTWLTFAIHLGHVSCVKFFIETGADCMRRDPRSWTALHMAEAYVSGPHPRAATELFIWPYQPPRRFVSEEDDQEILAVLQLATGTQPGLTSCPGHQRDTGGTPVSMQIDSPWSQTLDKLDIGSRWSRLLARNGCSVAFAVYPLASLIRAIKHDYHIIRLWSIAAELSRLTFVEALLLRTGYMASLIGLLLYMVIDLLLRIQDLV